MTDEPPRVPMPPPNAGWIGDGDIVVSATDLPRIGRRFHMDVDESVLARAGRAGLAAAVQRIGEAVAHRHQADIETAVHNYLTDRSWAEPIIKEAIRDAVRGFIRDIFQTRSDDD